MDVAADIMRGLVLRSLGRGNRLGPWSWLHVASWVEPHGLSPALKAVLAPSHFEGLMMA